MIDWEESLIEQPGEKQITWQVLLDDAVSRNLLEVLENWMYAVPNLAIETMSQLTILWRSFLYTRLDVQSQIPYYMFFDKWSTVPLCIEGITDIIVGFWKEDKNSKIVIANTISGRKIPVYIDTLEPVQ